MSHSTGFGTPSPCTFSSWIQQNLPHLSGSKRAKQINRLIGKESTNNWKAFHYCLPKFVDATGHIDLRKKRKKSLLGSYFQEFDFWNWHLLKLNGRSRNFFQISIIHKIGKSTLKSMVFICILSISQTFKVRQFDLNIANACLALDPNTSVEFLFIMHIDLSGTKLFELTMNFFSLVHRTYSV